MRTAGLRVFAAVVLTFALLSSTVLPIAAFAGPMLQRSPDRDDLVDADGRGHDGAGGPIAAARRLLEGARADYSQLLGLGLAGRSGGARGVDQPSMLAIPEVVLAAYRNAARNASSVVAGCSVDWPVLAGIGRVESRHGLFGGADTVIDTQGNIAQRIIGPALDGRGVASIPDSDKGRWDGDGQWDRAVGLMQFIPSSWRRYGQDGNADGVRDPHNVFDATLAAVDHLCSTQPGDLADDARLERALFSYNRSRRYVADVRRWIDIYRSTDPADLSSATTALQTRDGRRRNPFTGLLSSVAFDGSLPGGLGLGSPLGSGSPAAPAVTATPPTTRQSSGSDRTTPASERTRPPKPKSSTKPSPTPKPSPKPKAGKQPSPTPKPKASEQPSPTPDPSAPSDPTSPAPSAPSEQGSSTPAPSQAAPQPAPAPPPPEPAPAPPPEPAPAPPPPEPAPAPPKPEPPSPAPAPEPEPEPTDCPTPSGTSEPASPPDPACEPVPAP